MNAQPFSTAHALPLGVLNAPFLGSVKLTVYAKRSEVNTPEDKTPDLTSPELVWGGTTSWRPVSNARTLVDEMMSATQSGVSA